MPGYFYLFTNIEAAAKTDLSKALLIRQNNFAGKEYREADRQWVRVTGVMSSEPRRGWDPGTGVLLNRVQLLRDRPSPRIKDATVLGVFQNATNRSLAIELISRSEGGVTFFLAPHEADKTIIWEGQAVVSRLEGPDNRRLDLQKIGKPITSRAITFRKTCHPITNGRLNGQTSARCISEFLVTELNRFRLSREETGSWWGMKVALDRGTDASAKHLGNP